MPAQVVIENPEGVCGDGVVRPRPIQNDADHQAALARIDELWNAHPGTPEVGELRLWVHPVEKYESEKCPIPLPDPLEAIQFRMEQQGPK